MKKIVCELCDSTEFVKEGGFFVCQGCGTKYSAEEAKSMMREVEGEAAPAAGAPAPVSVPAGNPNQAQIDNILVLATTAYEAQNYGEAENYCNRAIELDAMCYKAWDLKGKAVGWQSKIDNLRIEEASHSFCKAIDFAPEEEKEEIKNQAVEELKKLGLALISLRKQRFSGSPDTAELNGFTSDRKVMLSSLLVLLQHGNAVGMPKGYQEEIATMMNQAGVAALQMTRQAWKGVEHPSKKDFDTYLGWNGNICQLFREAINASDEDEEEDIQRYKNLSIALKEPMDLGVCSYTREWNSYASRYDWVKEYVLSDSAVSIRMKEAADCTTKAAEMEAALAEKKKAEAKKAEEEKRQRIEAYWAAHPEEKNALEAEKGELTSKKDRLASELEKLEQEIAAAEKGKEVKTPSEEEEDRIREQIGELRVRRTHLGIFAGKEKKQIGEEIASLEGRISALGDKIEEEKKARDAEVEKKLAPLKARKEEINGQMEAAAKRIAAIEAEFAKDPE